MAGGDRRRRFLGELQTGLQQVNRKAFVPHQSVSPRSTETWGHVELLIPAEDMPGILAANPGIMSRDPVEREAAWDRFRASDASKPYRIPQRDTGRAFLSSSIRNASQRR